MVDIHSRKSPILGDIGGMHGTFDYGRIGQAGPTLFDKTTPLFPYSTKNMKGWCNVSSLAISVSTHSDSRPSPISSMLFNTQAQYIDPVSKPSQPSQPSVWIVSTFRNALMQTISLHPTPVFSPICLQCRYLFPFGVILVNGAVHNKWSEK